MKSLMKIAGALILAALLLLIAWMLLAPTEVHPVAWAAPDPALAAAGAATPVTPARLAQGQGVQGPETVINDASGHLLAGLADGRIVRLSIAASPRIETLANTGGRPLGLAWHPDGRLIVADGKLGLLAVDLASRKVTTLASTINGKPMGFIDNVAVAADGRYAYFSDASEKWHFGQDGEAIVEHGGDGRLLRYDFQTRTSAVLLDGLQFANGVALGPDGAYVLVSESGLYRVRRYWLTGPQAGSADIFCDNLPGIPDNLTFNGRDKFWVAIFTPRNPLLDQLSGHPYVRRMLARAMQILPRPIEHRSLALGFDTQGRLRTRLQLEGAHGYVPITNVHEAGAQLVFGSLTQDGLAYLPLTALP